MRIADPRAVLAAILILTHLAIAQTMPSQPTSRATTSPSTSPAPGPTTFPVITIPKEAPHVRLAEVATQANSASITLQGMEADLASDHLTETIQDELPVLTNELDGRIDETSRLLTSNPSIQTLRMLTADWQGVGENLASWKRDLAKRGTQMNEQMQRLQAMQADWEDALRRANRYSVKPEVRKHVDAVLAETAKTMTDVWNRRVQMWGLEQSVDEQDARVLEVIAAVKRASDQAFERLLVRDAPPIWQAAENTGSGQGLAQDSQVSFSAQVKALRAYAERWRIRFFIHSALALALGGLFRWLCSRVQKEIDGQPGATRATVVFKLPVATALMLSLLMSHWMYPQAPRLLWAMLGAVALVPAVILLRRLTDRALFPILNVLIVFYFTDQLRAVTAALPLVTRCLFEAEMLAGVIFLSWYIRARRVATASGHETPLAKKLTRTVTRLALLLFILGLLLNSVGFVSLSNLIGDAILSSAYLALILYTMLQIIDGLIIIILRVRPLSLLGMVNRHRELMQDRLSQLFRLVAVILWGLGTLGALSLRGPLFEAASKLLNSELTFGSLTISLGHMLAFALTVWAAFLLSRFLRFVLEEDVYARMHLASGLPYAISRMVHYVIVLIGFFMAVGALGYDMTKFTILAGAFGVGLGFGMQNIVNNFVSGLILLFERPVRVGDVIQMNNTTGIVARIGIRASIIRTPDSSEIIVPNGQLISDRVTNWTLSNRQRGIEIPVGVSSGADPRHVMELLIKVAAAHPMIAHDPSPQAFFVNFGADTFNFELRAWTNRAEQWVQVRSDLALAINETLNAAKIAIK